jgi:hypothetical protein
VADLPPLPTDCHDGDRRAPANAGVLDADALHSLADVMERESGPRAVASLASTCIALWSGHVFRLENGSGTHALKGRLDLLRGQRIDALTKKLECEDVLSLLRSSPDLYGSDLDASDARMIASLYLHELRGEANGKSIRYDCFTRACLGKRCLRTTSPPLSYSFDHGIHSDRGEIALQLPIDELMGVKEVDSIVLSQDLKGRGLQENSVIIICACIEGNRHLRELNLSGNNLAGETGYVKVTAVQGPSFNVNDRVIYQGCEMIVSEGIDSDGEIRMVNLMVVKALADALRVNPSVTSIDIGYNVIGQAASLELLSAMKDKNMVTIGMARCGLGVEGSKVVAEMVSGMASITVVDLRYNDLDTKSATMLATIAKEKKISLCGIAPNQSVADFTPKDRHNGPFMGPGDAILLTADLAVMASMAVVDLRYNNLDTKSATMLATIAKEKKISLCGITPTQSASVRWFATHGLIRTRVLLDFVPKHYFDGPFMGPGDAILLTADLAVMASVCALSSIPASVTSVSVTASW